MKFQVGDLVKIVPMLVEEYFEQHVIDSYEQKISAWCADSGHVETAVDDDVPLWIDPYGFSMDYAARTTGSTSIKDQLGENLPVDHVGIIINKFDVLKFKKNNIRKNGAPNDNSDCEYQVMLGSRVFWIEEPFLVRIETNDSESKQEHR